MTNARYSDASGSPGPGCAWSDDSAFDSWREAFAQLRQEERAFVQEWLRGGGPYEAGSRYLQLEALRQSTSRMFESAQFARRGPQ